MPKGSKMLERNPKDIKCGALLGVSVDHAELPLKQDFYVIII